MKLKLNKTIAALMIFGVTSGASFAHRLWILPSTTILSGDKVWVTMDAAVSNDLFYANHHALPLKSIKVTDPEGKDTELQNASEGSIRSTFDVEVTKQGTYEAESKMLMYFAQWVEGDEKQRWRGNAEKFKAFDMAGKSDVKFMKSLLRNVTYITNGKPNITALAPSNEGLELSFTDTHPNDLVEQEESTFTVLLNGEPAGDLEVEIQAGNQRFRSNPLEIKAKTDENGILKVTWPEPGRYWVSVETEGGVEKDNGKAVKLRYSLNAVFEVLPE